MSSNKTPTRTRILQATWNALENGDPDGVRMADIAKSAGISRQALYLHFPTRADLLAATTRHIDEMKGIDERLALSRAAETGLDRLDAFALAWGRYIPEIYGVARALMAMMDRDAEAHAAWTGRMNAFREGCKAAVKDLARDGDLRTGLSQPAATDLVAMILSVRNWEYLRHERGWSQKRYETMITGLLRDAVTLQRSE